MPHITNLLPGLDSYLAILRTMRRIHYDGHIPMDTKDVTAWPRSQQFEGCARFGNPRTDAVSNQEAKPAQVKGL